MIYLALKAPYHSANQSVLQLQLAKPVVQQSAHVHLIQQQGGALFLAPNNNNNTESAINMNGGMCSSFSANESITDANMIQQTATGHQQYMAPYTILQISDQGNNLLALNVDGRANCWSSTNETDVSTSEHFHGNCNDCDSEMPASYANTNGEHMEQFYHPHHHHQHQQQHQHHQQQHHHHAPLSNYSVNQNCYSSFVGSHQQFSNNPGMNNLHAHVQPHHSDSFQPASSYNLAPSTHECIEYGNSTVAASSSPTNAANYAVLEQHNRFQSSQHAASSANYMHRHHSDASTGKNYFLNSQHHHYPLSDSNNYVDGNISKFFCLLT